MNLTMMILLCSIGHVLVLSSSAILLHYFLRRRSPSSFDKLLLFPHNVLGQCNIVVCFNTIVSEHVIRILCWTLYYQARSIRGVQRSAQTGRDSGTQHDRKDLSRLFSLVLHDFVRFGAFDQRSQNIFTDSL